MSGAALVFAFVAAAALYGAYRVVTAELITHAALYLAVTFVAMAALFILLNAEFLAVVQLVIYAGAVMAVIVFAIMLSEFEQIGPGDEDQRPFFVRWYQSLRSPYWGLAPLVLSGALVALVIVAYNSVEWPSAGAEVSNTLPAMADALFSTYLIPFEIASLILLVAMIGAIVLTKEATDQ